MSQMLNNNGDPRIEKILEVIFRFAAGDLTARGALSGDDSALDGVIAGINILGEELEAKVAENQRAMQALSESEALFSTLFDSVQDGIIVADIQTRQYRMVNASICRMLGYSRQELLDLSVDDVHPAKDLPYVTHEFERMAKGETGLAPNIPMKRKDCSVFYADANTGPMMIDGVTCLVGVFRDITERSRAEQAEELARRDGLTGLYNRRTFDSMLEDEILRTQRFNRPVSLLMLDIDYFKRVNDKYGHQAGDAILKGMSDLLVKQARAVDSVCRYGGEEIAVILPETDTVGAMNAAERLRAGVERQSFDIGEGKAINITMSIGVATYPQQADSLEALVKASDVALYAAKEAGRNRVGVSSVR